MRNMERPALFHFNKIGDSNLGFISVAEQAQLPFKIERIYWTYFTPNEVVRGHHAHKKLQQIIIAVNGKIEFELEAIDNQKYEFTLDQPNTGLYIPEMTWRMIRFSHSAVLLCLASKKYEEKDYIRNYQEFCDYKSGKRKL